MKATIGLEAIGGLPKRMFPKTGIPLIDITFEPIPSPCWIAEIKGFGIRYRFDRVFVNGNVDYSKSNSKGTRGIFIWYVLESGHIYEVKESLSWSRIEQYFCHVSDDGETIKIPEKEVEAFCERECLRKFKEKKDAARAEETTRD